MSNHTTTNYKANSALMQVSIMRQNDRKGESL